MTAAAPVLAIAWLTPLTGIVTAAVLVPLLVALFGTSDLLAKGTSLLAIIPASVTGTIANVNQSGSVRSGEARLIIRDNAGSQVYDRDLKDTSTFQTSSGAPGTWRIEVRLQNVTGTLNFRVQKR